jgi:hypothetical protein
MSGYRIYNSSADDGLVPATVSTEDPPVIARIPDLDRNFFARKLDSGQAAHLSILSALSLRRFSKSKIAAFAATAAVLLIGGWIFFGGSDTDQSARESWLPTPPAASAPEAPLWNAVAESKKAVIKVDEALPHRIPGNPLPATFEKTPLENTNASLPDQNVSIAENRNTKPTQFQLAENSQTPASRPAMPTNTTTSRLATKPLARDILPRVAANRPLVIGTPIPPAKSTVENQDLSQLSKDEYYWMVRRHSVGNKTARTNEVKTQKPAAARLDGTIETPNVGMY